MSLASPRWQVRKDSDDACDLAKSCRRSGGRDGRSDAGEASPTFESELENGSNHSHTPIGHGPVSPSKQKHHGFRKHPDQDGRAREALTVFEAHSLAERFNLPTGHVTQAWKLFKRYDRHGRGLLGIHEFQMLLRTVLRERYPHARDVPRELFDKLSDHEEVDFSEFLTWITRNSFSELLLLTPGQRVIRGIARKFHKPVPFIEAIKREFDRFDGDGSGAIEYWEFCQLLSNLLGVHDPSGLPDNRVRSFWREIDDNGSGQIDFSEFIPWYITYFDTTGRPQGTSPLEEFYKRIRPVPFAICAA